MWPIRGLLLPVFLILLVGMVVGACDHAPQSAPTPAPHEPLSVLATAYPLADIVRRVGDREVHVEWLMESGQSLEALEITPELKNRLRSADLVVAGGINEPWAVAGFDDSNRGQHILRLDLLETARQSPGASAQLWLDPMIAREFTNALAERLGTLQPSEQATFRRNADALLVQIDSALAEFQPRLGLLSGTKVVVLSADFSALTSRFGLIELRPVEQSALRLSDTDITQLRQIARAQKAAGMLVGSDLSPEVLSDLQERTGLKIIPLDALGTSAQVGAGHSSYVELLRYNLQQLLSLR